MARSFIIKKDSLTKETMLKIAALGFLLIVTGQSPHIFTKVVRGYFKDAPDKARARARKLKELHKKRLIDFKELNNGDTQVILTHNGKKLIRRYNLDELKLKRPKKWDGKWRVIIYDIPVVQKSASEAFRQKIRDLGLFQIQKSVWVSPFDCLSEMEFLASVFEIDLNKSIYYFSATEIPKENLARRFFNL